MADTLSSSSFQISGADAGCLKTKTNMADLVKSDAPQDEKSSRPTVPNNILHTYFNIIKLKSVSENFVHDDYISEERP